ncbi:MAG TPA: cysteine--tRNA ligase [Planctomycetota bacterium]|nr:cysteine--tRNA ligase [Planctomycetota bacterium]
MPFEVHNSLTKRKEVFRSLEPGVVRMYNCGPTVYSRAHIGNFRAFLFADLLRRWLEHSGYTVRQVMNVTDVGHLTDEMAGAGEDRIEAAARREGLDPWKIAEEYTQLFLKDLALLGIQPAMVYPRASDHVPEMIEIIEGLIEKGNAYQVDGSVYFEVRTFPRYGRLSGNRIDETEAGARVSVREEKRDPADFALWKSDPHHLMKWKTRFGPDGFPGWHIECSAMARKHLGDRIDIHTGGEDNVFPHHECEIAQTESFTGEPFASYWMHSKFLQVDGGKMSKSLGNTYSVDDVIARGFSARALRFALLRGHYRQPLNYTWEVQKDSASALASLDDMVQRLQRLAKGEPTSASGGSELVLGARAEFVAGMDDDLNVARAVSALFGLRSAVLEGRLSRAAAVEAQAFLAEVNRVLGVLELEQQDIGARVQARIDERQAARKNRDFRLADKIRDELQAEGIALEDTPKGVVWRRRS